MSGLLALVLAAGCGGVGTESFTDGDPDHPVITGAASSATQEPAPHPEFKSSAGVSIACAGCHPQVGDDGRVGAVRWNGTAPEDLFGGATASGPLGEWNEDYSVDNPGCLIIVADNPACVTTACPVGNGHWLSCTAGLVECGAGRCEYF